MAPRTDKAMWHRLSDKESPEKEAAIVRLLTNAVASGKDGDLVLDVLRRCDEADATELVKLNVHSSIMRQLRRLTFEDIQNEDGWDACARVLCKLAECNNDLCRRLVDMGILGLLFEFKIRRAENKATTQMFALLMQGIADGTSHGQCTVMNALKNSKKTVGNLVTIMTHSPLDEAFFVAGCSMLSLLMKDDNCTRLLMECKCHSGVARAIEQNELGVEAMDALELLRKSCAATLQGD